MNKLREDLSQLHDATLGVIVVDYAAGAVTIALRLSVTGTPVAELKALGFTKLQVPKSEEWGQSTSVNKATIAKLDGERTHLFLQLQSGDELTVDATTIELIRG